ncbi:MAG: two component regulator propeller domain protein [Bacteroidetes bacterium]|jgi:photosystem II stability/assembly factor-like uncharacterized protein|nr:two component regulator propeller domain protein [Bacteroidota bacterium]
MKKLAILLIIALYANLSVAQWRNTSGPFGEIHCVESGNGNLFVGTDKGLYLSSDNGNTWTSVNTGLPAGRAVKAVAINGTTIFAGVDSNGVYRSTNNGSSWTAANAGLTNTHAISFLVYGSTIFVGTIDGVFSSTNNGNYWNPSNTGMTYTVVNSIVYNGTYIFAGTSDGVYISYNNGSNWYTVNNGITNDHIHSLSVSGTKLFAAAYTYGSSGGSMYVSTDNGTTWNDLSTGLDQMNVCAVIESGSNLFAGVNNDGVIMSSDNGNTWTEVNTGMDSPGFSTDIYTLTLSGSTLYASGNAGNEYNLFKSTDNGSTWTGLSTGLTNRRAYGLAGDGSRIFAITAHDALMSTNNGSTWTEPNTGSDNFFSSIAINGPTIYGGLNDDVVFSTDNGSTWTGMNAFLSYGADEIAFNGSTIYVVDHITGLQFSTDNGLTWTPADATVPTGIYSLAIQDGSMYAGSYGELYISIDNASTWTLLSTGITDDILTSLAISGTNIFASTLSHGIFLSTDGGLTWAPANTGLTTNAIHSLTISGTNIYAGTDFDGVFTRPLSEMINCVSFYTTSYDTLSNTFTLTIDSLSSAMAVGYHWDFGDGASSALQAPSHTYAVDSLYNVCMTIYTSSGESCSYCHVIGIDSLGNIIRNAGFNLVVNPFNTTGSIQKESAEPAIRFFPNPFSSQTIIETDHSFKDATLTLYNSLGQQVREIKNSSGKKIILHREDLAGGIYFLKLSQDNKIILAERVLITD